MTEIMDYALKCNLLKRKGLSHCTQLLEMMALTKEAIQRLFKQNFHSRNLVEPLNILCFSGLHAGMIELEFRQLIVRKI